MLLESLNIPLIINEHSVQVERSKPRNTTGLNYNNNNNNNNNNLGVRVYFLAFLENTFCVQLYEK